jgi:hypothetical protein
VIKSRKIRWTGNATYMSQMRNAYVLVGKPEEKRPLGRHRCRWEDNITLYLTEIGCLDLSSSEYGPVSDFC